MIYDDAAPIIKRGETRDIVKVKKEEHSYKYNPVKDEDTGEENDDTISSVVLCIVLSKTTCRLSSRNLSRNQR